MRVQYLQLQQEQMAQQNLQRTHHTPTVYKDNLATPYPAATGRNTPQPKQQFQQQNPRRSTAYPEEDPRSFRRQETPQRSDPRQRSGNRPGTPSNLLRRRTPVDYLQHQPQQDTYTDDEEVEDIHRKDNLTETELNQLPVKMPRFGFGDYLSQQSCFRNLPTITNGNAKYMVAHMRQILETRIKERLSETEWIDVIGYLVRVVPDCNRSYCEDSFSGYSGSV